MEHEKSHPEDQRGDFGPGLRLFPAGMPAAERRRRTVFLVGWIVVSLLLVWPVYPFFADVEPLILGLPLSLAWVLLVMAWMCALLLWLFLGDERDGRRGEASGG